jgi:hypothetical protein
MSDDMAIELVQIEGGAKGWRFRLQLGGYRSEWFVTLDDARQAAEAAVPWHAAGRERPE